MISALKQYQRDIIKFMDRDLSRAFEELSSIVIVLKPNHIATQLRNIMVEEQKDRNIQIGPIAKYQQIVSNNWGTVSKDASNIFGNQNVKVINNIIYIRVWDGGRTPIKKAGFSPYKSFEDVQRKGIPQFKRTFQKLLEKVVGKDAVDEMSHPETTAGSGKLTGDKAFNQKFTLSHRQMAAGEQVSTALKDEVSRRSLDAKDAEGIAKTQQLKSYNIGKQKFYDATETHMSSVMAAATLVQIGNNTKNVDVGGQSFKVPGSFEVLLTFDEIAFNRAYGQKHFKKDINVLKKAWEDWAKRSLTNILGSQKNAADIWELKGSSSRKESTEALMQRAVESHIVKARKNLVLKTTSGKAKKPKAKKQKTKATPVGKKKRATKVKRAVANKKVKKPRKQTVKRGTGARMPAHSPVALMHLLNKILPTELQKNMTGVYPRSLEYRTGRFAQSAEVTSVVPFSKMTQIQYTYQKDPYAVFETGSGNPLASGGRDPRRIIGSTIREIAQEIMGEKFGIIRTKRV